MPMSEQEQERHFKMMFAAEFAKGDGTIAFAMQVLIRVMAGLNPKMEWLQATSKLWAFDSEVLSEIERIKNFKPTADELKAIVLFDYMKASDDIKAKMQRNVLEAFGVIKKGDDDTSAKGIDKLKELLEASAK